MMSDPYFDHPAWSQSDLKDVLDCPKAVWENKLSDLPISRKRPVTPAMKEGTVLHSAILEPAVYKTTYAVTGPRNTKAGKEQAAKAEAAGFQVITQTLHDKAAELAHRVKSHPLAAELFEEGRAEVPLFDTDEATALQVKGKLDWLRDTDETVVDLKTVGGGNASPANFAKQVANFKYHLQAAHYLELAKAKRFVFVVVEREFPFQVGVYELDDDALAEGRYLRRQALDLVAQCVAFNDWPGHTDDQVQTLSLPHWYS
jgi:hypothetical protein